MMTDEAFHRIDALIQVGLRLARSAPSGQILLARIHRAIDPEWIPRPWGETILAELDDARGKASEPIPAKRVEGVLRDAWGSRPTDELDEFDLEPVAVTPTAQVHRGVLDGAQVAVKVLRPGLAASVRQDLSVIERLMSPLGAAFPGVDPNAIVREFRERVLDEFDLEHEAGSQRRFHRALRGHPFLTVPAPVTRLAHEHVLVSEWVEGVPLWQAQDPDQAAARLLVFVLGAARSGIIHADPDPDDVLVRADGRLAILDFGAVRTVDPKRVDLAAVALEAFAAGDPRTLGDALEPLGWLPGAHAGTALELGQYALAELAGPEPARLDVDAVTSSGRRLSHRREALVELILAGSLPPEDLWPARAFAQLFGAIARVGATGPWQQLALKAVRDGWSASP